MTPLDTAMLRFARFLDRSWEVVRGAAAQSSDPDELMSDWAQANWEILVEAPLRAIDGLKAVFLEPYGEGADCNYRSSRVWKPEAPLTHRVVCQPRGNAALRDLLTGKPVDPATGRVVFDHFTARTEDGWHEQAAPFDCVLGYVGDQEVLVAIEDVTFELEDIGEPIQDGSQP